MIRLSVAVAPLVLAAAGLASACSSEPPPPSLAKAEQAIHTARQENAAAYAPRAMQAAENRLQAAQQATKDNRGNTAERLSQEALVNAEYANARVDEAQAQNALNNIHRAAGGQPAQAATNPSLPSGEAP